MPPYTDSLTEALRLYAEATDARTKILQSQAYAIGGRSNTRAALAEVNKDIRELDKRINVLRARAARGGIRIRGAVPLP
jgi:hypothetical protein